MTLKDALSAFILKNAKEGRYFGILGDEQGNLDVTDEAGNVLDNVNWCQVNFGLGSGLSVVAVRNQRVSEQAGLNVWVGRSLADGELEVLEQDPQAAQQFMGGLIANVPSHAWSHGFYGPDTDYIDQFRVLPGLVHPTYPADLTVTIEACWLYISGIAYWYAGAVVDLTSLVPSNPNEQRIIIVGIDPTTQLADTIDVTAVVPVGADTTDLMPFVETDIETALVGMTINPLAAVRLYYSQTEIQPSDMISDLRSPIGGLLEVIYYQLLRNNGTDKTKRSNINFVDGSGVAVTLTDDSINNETEVKTDLSINTLTEDASPDGAADYVVTYDTSAGSHKKVLVDNIASGSTVDTSAQYLAWRS